MAGIFSRQPSLDDRRPRRVELISHDGRPKLKCDRNPRGADRKTGDARAQASLRANATGLRGVGENHADFQSARLSNPQDMEPKSAERPHAENFSAAIDGS
jgi:hypothetical protein